MLFSFAQFDREVTAERIHDKIAASKRKDLWMGGHVPLGYEPDERTRKITEVEAQTIITVYDIYERQGTVRGVKTHADAVKLTSRKRTAADSTITGGNLFGRGHIHHILTNPTYAGRIRHKTAMHDGQHDAIIEQDRWDRIQPRGQNSANNSRSCMSEIPLGG